MNVSYKSTLIIYSQKITKDEAKSIYKLGLTNSIKTKAYLSKWPFTSNDLNMLVEDNTGHSNWEFELFHPNQKIVESLEDIDYKTIRKVKPDGLWIFSFSDALYNNEMTAAIVGVNITKGMNISEKFVLVYKKMNDEWIIVNKVASTELN